MPLYVYQCPKCGDMQEVLVPHVHPPQLCRSGCGIEMQRVPTTAAFTVKGFNAANRYSK